MSEFSSDAEDASQGEVGGKDDCQDVPLNALDRAVTLLEYFAR